MHTAERKCLALGKRPIKGDCYYLLGLPLWAARCKFNDGGWAGWDAGAGSAEICGPAERAGPVSARTY